MLFRLKEAREPTVAVGSLMKWLEGECGEDDMMMNNGDDDDDNVMNNGDDDDDNVEVCNSEIL